MNTTKPFIAVTTSGADDLLLALSQRRGDEVGSLLQRAVDQDRMQLERLGAVAGDKLTDAGKQLVPLVQNGLPTHLARVLTAANSLGCLADAIRLVALFRPGRTLRYRPAETVNDDETQRERCRQADQAHLQLTRQGYKTDLGRLLGAYDALVDLQRSKGPSALVPFCEQNYLSHQVFIDANRCHQWLLQMTAGVGLKRTTDRADEDKLVLALLHGLTDCLCDFETNRGHRHVYSSALQEGFLIAPGSTIRSRQDSLILLSLFVIRGESQRRRHGAQSGRPYTLVTEAVEVNSKVLAEAEALNLFKVRRGNFVHREWGHDKDVATCSETWYALDGSIRFSRDSVPAPACEEAGIAFAWSLVGRPDHDDFMRDRKPVDPVVVSARQLCRLSGGRFPEMNDRRLVEALGRKLADATTWTEVQRRKQAGELVIGWNDVAAVCGIEAPTLAALRADIETNYPTMLNVGGSEVAITYMQGGEREEARVEIPATNRAALANLKAEHLPTILASRSVRILVTGIGQDSFYRGVSVSGSFDDLDGLRRRVELEVNRPSQPTLPGGVSDLVRTVTVAHPDGRTEVMYLMHGRQEPLLDATEAQQLALAQITDWLRQQAVSAGAPHQLSQTVYQDALASVGSLDTLVGGTDPTSGDKLSRSNRLDDMSRAVQEFVKVFVTVRVTRRAELLERLKLACLQARQVDRLEQVQDRVNQVQLLLGSSEQPAVVEDAKLDQAAEVMVSIDTELPKLDSNGGALLQLSARLEVLRSQVKAVAGELRQERRQACEQLQVLIQRGQLEQATTALAAAEKLFTETGLAAARGQTKRLRGGK